MNINLTNVTAAETQTKTTTFKSVQPGIHELTITKVEGAKAGSKDVLKVTFSSKEAEAEFSHNFFLTEKALPSVQYLITKFTGAPLEGNFSVEALSAVLVGKTQPRVVVDGQVVPKNKDGKWYNNTFPRLRFAGFVDPQGDDAEPLINRDQEMNLAAVNAESPTNTGTATTEDDDSLPF